MKAYGAIEPTARVKERRSLLAPAALICISGLVAVAIISQLIDDSVQPIETADYWPGFTEDEVIPDRHASRDEFQPLNWIGNGYGLYTYNGTAGLTKGFFGKCNTTQDCANLDTCFKSRCVPTVLNGTLEVCKRLNPGDEHKICEIKFSAKGNSNAQLSARQQQLLVNMAYQHHEIFNAGGYGMPDDGSLPAVSSQTLQAAEEAESRTPSAWQDPVSGEWSNDHTARQRAYALRQTQLAQAKRRVSKAPLSQKAQVTHPLEEGNYDLVSIGDGLSPEQTYRINPRDYGKFVAAAAANNRMQQLAMGEGIPVDLTFGVGADGEAPLHLQTTAESVHNGALDPNAPEALPYANIVGSGSDDHLSAVGYLQ